MLTHIVEGGSHQRALEGDIPSLEDALPHDLNGNGGPEEHLHVSTERSRRIMLEGDKTCLVDAKTLRLCANAFLHEELHLCDALEESMHHQE